MSWQKTARFGLAAFVVVFGTIVFVALKQRKPAAPVEAVVRLRDPNANAETSGGVWEQFKDRKVVWSLKFDRQSSYPDGRTKLEGVTLRLPDRNGRTMVVTSDAGDRVTTDAESIGQVHLIGHVKLTTSDGAVVTADEATYDEGSGLLDVPGPVAFTRGRMKGSGVGATYDRDREVLWVLDQSHITVAEGPGGQGAIEATSGSAGLARAEHYLRLTRNGRMTSEGRVIEADEITVRLTDDDERLRMLELRGKSRMTGGPGGRGVQSMEARDIDLSYAEDGRTLQHALLIDNAVVHLPGERKSGGRRIAGKTIDIGMAPDGAAVTNLNATESVQVDLPADGDSPAKRIRSASLIATGAGAAGLEHATFAGAVDYRESRAAKGAVVAVDRTARAQTLIVRTKPGFGAVQEADFHGHVHITDGPKVVADAPRVVYHLDRDRMDLSPPGDPGEGPRVSDGRVTVSARTIELTLGTRKLQAETAVSSSLLPQRSAPAGRGAAAAGSNASARVPSILKADQPVNVTSNRLEYDGAAGHARYEGNARLWQVQPDASVSADTIIIDDKSGNLEALGTVRTVTMLEDEDPKTHVRRLTRTTGEGDAFLYEDARRLATYTTNARIIGAQGDMRGDKIELFLEANANEVERAEGYGSAGAVIVKEAGRTATGERLTYTAKDETYLMTGKPVEVIEAAPPDCKQSFGSTLTFKRAADTVSMTGGPDRLRGKAIPCPAETR